MSRIDEPSAGRAIFAALLLGLTAFATAPGLDAQQYGARLGAQEGGAISFEPRGRGVMFGALDALQPNWEWILWAMAVLTMIVGNVIAVVQLNIKRMLAYSSVAHAGYILIGIVAGGSLGSPAILFYLLVYTFMNIGAFAVVMVLESKGDKNLLVTDYAGLGFKHPLLGLAMAVFMFSLAGIPPTAGFMGKFYIFSAAVKEGYYWLAVLGVTASMISVYYYLRVLVYMYMKEPEKATPALTLPAAIAATLIVAAAATMLLGVFPDLAMSLARQL